MDRRSFIMALVGGMAVAGTGGIAAAQAAQPVPAPQPEPKAAGEVPADMAEGLDKADSEFSQYYYRRRPRYVRRYYRPRYYRPRYYRPRAYYRPRRRVYFY